MKIPMKWIRDYVDTDLPASEYAAQMIMTGTAVEGIEPTGAQFDHVVVGRVLTCEPHPDSDHLHVCTVDVGAEVLNIVCGAPNVAAGQLVCVALEGAHLPGGVKIKKGKLRGVESRGMLCSGPELDVPEGLYPHVGNSGIIVLNEEYPLGTDVKEVFGLGDDIVDFEILANRPDCLSVWGIARESASVLDTHLIMPEIAVTEDGQGSFDDYARVKVEDETLCPRYCARVITDVKLAPSPKWMREYLYGAGVRPINNIVDITNFIMLETGHPMHAFDLDKVRNQQIIVRRAHEGETLTTLDGKTHSLTPDMLVIADEARATGLAGIMGGEESEITADTQRVLFECAAFERSNNRVTARTLGIRTESSGRFERGVCAETADVAIERACMLVNMLACGKVVPGRFDHYPNPEAPVTICAQTERIRGRIGVNVSDEAMEEILNRLNIETTLVDGTLESVPPVDRKDLETEADLAEEILRMYGYNHIPTTLMNGETVPGFRSENQRMKDRLRRWLADQGFYEALTFSFVTPRWAESLRLPEGDARLNPVRLRNFLGEDTSVMRTSLVPSMLATLALNNNRGNACAKLFEVAAVFQPKGEGALPEERPTLCIGMYGDKIDFYCMKRTVLGLIDSFGVTAREVVDGDPYLHPGRKLSLYVGDTKLGQLGEVHPDVGHRFDLDCRAYVAEIDVNALKEAHAAALWTVTPLPKYPAVTRDIAITVEETVRSGEVMQTIAAAAGKCYEYGEMFDVYRDERLGANKKSLAFSVTFRAPDRTLTDTEIQSYMDKILRAVEQAHGAEIRK